MCPIKAKPTKPAKEYLVGVLSKSFASHNVTKFTNVILALAWMYHGVIEKNKPKRQHWWNSNKKEKSSKSRLEPLKSTGTLKYFCNSMLVLIAISFEI